jgi:hypothetical protein
MPTGIATFHPMFNVLAGFLAQDGYQDHLVCFRTRQPSGCAGCSIFIHEVE